MKSAILDRLEASSLEAIEVNFGEARALVTLHGAHLVSYTHQGVERLWMSPKSLLEPNQPIRGGVPVCWPWFGPHTTDPSRPAHGFARTSIWTLLEQSETAQSALVRLGFTSPDSHYPLRVEYQLELSATALEMRLITENFGSDEVELTEALHTYLPVSDLKSAALYGLQGIRYSDKLLDYAESTETRTAVYLTEPTDRVYFDSSDKLELIDSESGKKTVISKTGSATTVVWNAGEQRAATIADLGAENYRGYICVEAANALQARIILAPGQRHTLSQSICPSAI